MAMTPTFGRSFPSGVSGENMGNKQGNQRSEGVATERDEKVEECDPFITLCIFVEMPSGLTTEYTVDTNPTKLVSNFKSDLEHLLHIPVEHIKIYRHINPGTEMPNRKTLENLGVTSEIQLRIRDGRLKYEKPIKSHAQKKVQQTH